MFAAAIARARAFIRPVVVSQRYASGKVEAIGGTCIILNPDGWALTSARVVECYTTMRQHEAERAAARRGRPANPNWIVNQSFWWGADGVSMTQMTVDTFQDLALIRLKPFDGAWVGHYPAFVHPKGELPQGKSLCALGFPFTRMEPTFDEAHNAFVFGENALVIPTFPMNGIMTRLKVLEDVASHQQARFIEMSMPVLRGQFGGPVFDTDGNIWGLCSHTESLPLGLAAHARVNGREVTEHQFLNVGFAVHAEAITRFLAENGVTYNVAAL